MLEDAIARDDISLACFQSRDELYLASFRWQKDELQVYGRRCGKGGVFLMKNSAGKNIGFITFSLDAAQQSLTMNTGGTTGKYRNMGYGIPMLDSFYSLLFVMGITRMTITSGIDNPFVLMLIDTRYGFGPVKHAAENAMVIGGLGSAGDSNRFPVHFLGEAARQRIEHEESESPPDPFGPSYQAVENIEAMPGGSTTVYVGEFYRIEDRLKFYRRILTFLPELYHRPDASAGKRRIIWKSRNLTRAQSYLASTADKQRPTT
jgi:hypothetical protein